MDLVEELAVYATRRGLSWLGGGAAVSDDAVTAVLGALVVLGNELAQFYLQRRARRSSGPGVES